MIIFTIPIALILIVFFGALFTGGVLANMLGLWIFDHKWYIFAFFCIVFLINFFLILKESNIICALSGLVATSSVLFYTINRSFLLGEVDEIMAKLNVDYILCVIFYIAIAVSLTYAVIRASWYFLEDYSGKGTISEIRRESFSYSLKMLGIGALCWGFDAFVFFVIVPIYSFTY